MATSAMQARRLDYIRFLGLEYSETYKEWHARLEVKDSACAIRQTASGAAGRKLHLLDPKSRSFTIKLLKVQRAAAGADAARAWVTLELSDGSTPRIELGQIMLRDAHDPQWRYYEAPESDDRLDLSRFV